MQRAPAFTLECRSAQWEPWKEEDTSARAHASQGYYTLMQGSAYLGSFYSPQDLEI